MSLLGSLVEKPNVRRVSLPEAMRLLKSGQLQRPADSQIGELLLDPFGVEIEVGETNVGL
jgi:hypothetical protein